MSASSILEAVHDLDSLNTDSIACTENSIAGLDEDDFYNICDYLASKKINHDTDRRSMTGLWVIEINF